ncbi:hypothetical protein ACQ5SO_04425 [Rhodovulum sp. DZ06]|uniref:hypothetical protein n=1 Tax=Rhodovulum sp. DZ06 TaxID=3425126 RepID=UPI003D32D772
MLVAALLAAIGAAFVLAPDILAASVGAGAGADPLSAASMLRGFGFATLALSAGLAGAGAGRAGAAPLAVGLLITLLSLLALRSYAAAFWAWRLDAAGVDFAYARSVALGWGAVAGPGAAPFEGYGSSLWMLALAGMHALGLAIIPAAKALALGMSAVTLLLVLDGARRLSGGLAAVPAAAAVCLSAPLAIWACAGQEDALHALLTAAIAWAAIRGAYWRGAATALLTLLVLARPEAPLAAAAVCAAGAALDRGLPRGTLLRRNLPLLLVPLAALAGLTAFRAAYFGDAVPPRLWAGAGALDLAGALNPFGGGWAYLLGGLGGAGLALAAVPAALAGPRRAGDASAAVPAALLGAQAAAVILSGGDAYGQWRLLAPAAPLLALLFAAGIRRLPAPRMKLAALACAAGLMTAQATAVQGLRFAAAPAAPFSVAAETGAAYAALAARLGVGAPLLAHSRGGAILYLRDIPLLDLSGASDRRVAAALDDPGALAAHVLEERRPAFIHGPATGAALRGFAERPDLAAAYVPLVWEGRPRLAADLSHLRRDLARAVPGVIPVHDGGEIAYVIVHDPGR